MKWYGACSLTYDHHPRTNPWPPIEAPGRRAGTYGERTRDSRLLQGTHQTGPPRVPAHRRRTCEKRAGPRPRLQIDQRLPPRDRCRIRGEDRVIVRWLERETSHVLSSRLAVGVWMPKTRSQAIGRKRDLPKQQSPSFRFAREADGRKQRSGLGCVFSSFSVEHSSSLAYASRTFYEASEISNFAGFISSSRRFW
jgi:hypothetical protein